VPALRLAALAAELGCAFEGDGEVELDGVASLADARPHELAFVRSARFAGDLARTRAGGLVAPPGIDTGGRPTIRSPRPGLDFARAVRRLHPALQPPPGIHPAAHLDPAAEVSPGASVGAGCVIGARARVGPRSVLHPNVTVYPDVSIGVDCEVHSGCVLREETVLGDRVVLQPGVVLGGDGFGYEPDAAGKLVGVPQVGRVLVEDDVEIGANTTVDRATLGETVIARRSKLDNLVQVGHNCAVGPDAVIVAQGGLGGSTVVGRGAVLMARAGVVDHARVGDAAFVGPGAGVTGDVPDGARVLGAPHVDAALARRIFAAWRRLPQLFARVRRLERALRAAEEGAPTGPAEARRPERDDAL